MKDYLPNPTLFVSGTILHEAIKSNEIEGRMTELEEVLTSEDDDDPQTDEIKNYVKAATNSFKELRNEKSKGLTESLLLKTHAEMMGIKKSKYKTIIPKPTKPTTRNLQLATFNSQSRTKEPTVSLKVFYQ